MFQLDHAALPKATHDEFAREEFCASLRKVFTTELFPGASDVYQKQVLPDFKRRHDRAPNSAKEAKAAMEDSFYFRGMNVVGRAAQELLWDVVGESIERQVDDLSEMAKPKAGELGTLRLNPDMKIPAISTRSTSTSCRAISTPNWRKTTSSPARSTTGASMSSPSAGSAKRTTGWASPRPC